MSTMTVSTVPVIQRQSEMERSLVMCVVRPNMTLSGVPRTARNMEQRRNRRVRSSKS